jgi:hypothetical protein
LSEAEDGKGTSEWGLEGSPLERVILIASNYMT